MVNGSAGAATQVAGVAEPSPLPASFPSNPLLWADHPMVVSGDILKVPKVHKNPSLFLCSQRHVPSIPFLHAAAFSCTVPRVQKLQSSSCPLQPVCMVWPQGGLPPCTCSQGTGMWGKHTTPPVAAATMQSAGGGGKKVRELCL